MGASSALKTTRVTPEILEKLDTSGARLMDDLHQHLQGLEERVARYKADFAESENKFNHEIYRHETEIKKKEDLIAVLLAEAQTLKQSAQDQNARDAAQINSLRSRLKETQDTLDRCQRERESERQTARTLLSERANEGKVANARAADAEMRLAAAARELKAEKDRSGGLAAQLERERAAHAESAAAKHAAYVKDATSMRATHAESTAAMQARFSENDRALRAWGTTHEAAARALRQRCATLEAAAKARDAELTRLRAEHQDAVARAKGAEELAARRELESAQATKAAAALEKCARERALQVEAMIEQINSSRLQLQREEHKKALLAEGLKNELESIESDRARSIHPLKDVLIATDREIERIKAAIHLLPRPHPQRLKMENDLRSLLEQGRVMDRAIRDSENHFLEQARKKLEKAR